MKNESLDRKNFFKRVSLFGISAIGASTLLKACGGGASEEAAPAPAAQSEEAAPAPAAQVYDDPCADLSGLSDSDKQMRANLQYVAETPNPEQRCDNCALWIDPPADSPCGGCTIMAGPFHPAGWCTAWAAKA